MFFETLSSFLTILNTELTKPPVFAKTFLHGKDVFAVILPDLKQAREEHPCFHQ